MATKLYGLWAKSDRLEWKPLRLLQLLDSQTVLNTYQFCLKAELMASTNTLREQYLWSLPCFQLFLAWLPFLSGWAMPPAWPSSHNSLVGLHGIYKDVSKRDKKRVRVHVSVTRGGNLFRAVTWPQAQRCSLQALAPTYAMKKKLAPRHY